jgi:dihydrofolate synthase/folylpolyglutamate synthase
VNYTEAIAWLYGTQERGIKLGLHRVREFLDTLGWQPGGTRFIHVAGTNGKGSVCAMADAICRAAGLRTGLFTSPHLITFRERIRIDGEMAPPEEIAAELTRIRGICDGIAALPTFFEITTGLALEIFRRRQVEVGIIEVGLGGRLDSTNVLTPAVSVITSIGLDHMQLLGGTIEEIAWEKAGIIKPGVPVVTGLLPPEAAEVVAQVAATRAAHCIPVREPVPYPLALEGAHQRLNAAVALCALQVAGLTISADAARSGLQSVSWPGRFQDTGNGFIIDGAHNPAAARALVETWRGKYGDRRTEVILGIVRDKDAQSICAELAPIANQFVIVPVRSPRAGSVEILAGIASAYRPTRISPSLEKAISSARLAEAPVLITGSLFLVGEALVALGLAEGEQEISAQ